MSQTRDTWSKWKTDEEDKKATETVRACLLACDLTGSNPACPNLSSNPSKHVQKAPFVSSGRKKFFCLWDSINQLKPTRGGMKLHPVTIRRGWRRKKSPWLWVFLKYLSRGLCPDIYFCWTQPLGSSDYMDQLFFKCSLFVFNIPCSNDEMTTLLTRFCFQPSRPWTASPLGTWLSSTRTFRSSNLLA